MFLRSDNYKADDWQGYHLLKKVFQNWETLSTDAEICIVCDQLVHISKEDKREVRKQAEVEKVMTYWWTPVAK